MDLADIMAQLPGELVLPDPRWDGRCPTCGCATSSAQSGPGLRLCLQCTEAEVGERLEDLTRRMSRRMTRNAYAKLPVDNDGRAILPALTYRAWRALTR